MSFNHYYQSELTALRHLGKRFAERSPALAPFLGQAGRDPDVERLLEGFAFLTGRLRQKLDDEIEDTIHDRRAWHIRIIRIAEEIDDVLDDNTEAFDELRKPFVKII